MILEKIRLFQESIHDIEIIKKTEAYGYNYATLVDILNVINPFLKKYKIWYSHTTDYEITHKCNVIKTVIYCVDNEEDCIVCRTLIDNEASIAKMNRFMIEGSAITYFRRYHLTTMLGITTDEDTDAGGKRVKKGEGRSIEASTAVETKADFVSIFSKQAKTKTKAQFEKTFEAYKPQMSNEEIETVNKILIETYGQ